MAQRIPRASDFSATDVALSTESVQDNIKIARSLPTQKTLLEEFGERSLSHDAQGWKITARGQKQKRVAYEMTREARRLQIERGRKLQARRAQTRARRLDGSIINIDQKYEGLIAATGTIRPYIRLGGFKVVQGPDGLLYRENGRGGFECTGKRQVGVMAEVVAPHRIGELLEV